MTQVIASAEPSSATLRPQAFADARRIWEVDVWRGIAIACMVIFHFVYDLRVFVGMDINLFTGFWFYFQRFTATSFILLVGISLAISYHRACLARGSEGLHWKYLRRGLKIFGAGMAITLAMQLTGNGRIDYGVLHFIGTAVVISYPFLRFRWLNLVLAGALFAVSYPISEIQVDSTTWVWLGLTPSRYAPADYFPLVHWFSIVLVGIFMGQTLYTDAERQFSPPDLSRFFPVNLLQFLGRYSLLIYVIHQPALMALMITFGLIRLGA